MAKRRANGEGCIHKRKDGRWMAKVTIGWDSKTQKVKMAYFYGRTQEEVKTKLLSVNHAKQTGTYTEPSKMTFGEWLDIWLNEYSKPNIRPTTYDFYEYLCRIHIKPNLGVIALKDLQPEHLQRFYNQKRNEKVMDRKKKKAKQKEEVKLEERRTLSPRTIRYMQIVINLALSKAVECWKIARNPNESIEVIKAPKAKVQFLEPEQIAEFLESISNDDWYAALLTELGTGMRVGELAALKWCNVDLNKGIIHVREAVSRVNTNEKDGEKSKLVFQPPKTEKGIRSIPIPIDVIQELKKLKTEQKRLRRWITRDLNEIEKDPEEQESSFDENSFVFAWEDNRIVEPGFLSKHFLKLIRARGYKNIHFHSLRHSYATLLLKNGEDLKVIQENLGHSTLQITSDTYTHVVEELKEKAAVKLNGFSRTNKISANQ